MMKCFSIDDENFNYDSLGDLIMSTSPEVGDFYYEADCVDVIVDNYLVNHLLEDADDLLYDDLGEIYDSDFSKVSDEAKKELLILLQTWAAKHVNLDRYWKIVGESRKLQFTKEDLE
jgi:hypothetical protein